MGTGGSFAGEKVAWGVRLTVHIHLVPRLRMNGAITSTPLHVFRPCIGKTSLFFLFCILLYQRLFLYRQKDYTAGFTSYAQQHNIHIFLSTDSRKGNPVLHRNIVCALHLDSEYFIIRLPKKHIIKIN
jgi:hypothetical protein